MLSLAFIKGVGGPITSLPLEARFSQRVRGRSQSTKLWPRLLDSDAFLQALDRTSGTENRSAHGSGPAAQGTSRTKARTEAGSGSSAEAQGPLMGVPGGPRPGEATTVSSLPILRWLEPSARCHGNPAGLTVHRTEAGICRWSWWDAEN